MDLSKETLTFARVCPAWEAPPRKLAKKTNGNLPFAPRFRLEVTCSRKPSEQPGCFSGSDMPSARFAEE